MLSPITYLGYVKRGDIEIIINRPQKPKGVRAEYELDKFEQIEAILDVYKRQVPPSSKGDYAFVLHMLASLDAENGRMAIVLPHGVLFRGASEGKIRKQIVEFNLLDAVIGLPANLFYGTGIPACILAVSYTHLDAAVPVR